jgi:hypothetical protein
MSIFSENEEVRASDEGGINNLLSHKKPYASRMVMSIKKPYEQIKFKGERATVNGPIP